MPNISKNSKLTAAFVFGRMSSSNTSANFPLSWVCINSVLYLCHWYLWLFMFIPKKSTASFTFLIS